MNKKTLVLAGVAVCTSLALMFSGCTKATNAATAAKMSVGTAQRAENVVAKLDTVEISDFKFPTAFGNDFFANESSSSNGIVNTSMNFSSDLNSPQTKNSARRIVNNNPNRYKSKHFDSEKLNNNNTARNAYLDKMDDLYVLCADIAAANNAVGKLSTEIKRESTRMKQTAVEFKDDKTNRTKEGYKKLNELNDKVNGDLNRLANDRYNVKRRVKSLPKSGNDINVEAMTKRYAVVMNRLDTRLELLSSLKGNMQLMNQDLCEALGTCAPVTHISTPNTQTKDTVNNTNPKKQNSDIKPKSSKDGDKIKQVSQNNGQRNWFKRQKQNKENQVTTPQNTTTQTTTPNTPDTAPQKVTNNTMPKNTINNNTIPQTPQSVQNTSDKKETSCKGGRCGTHINKPQTPTAPQNADNNTATKNQTVQNPVRTDAPRTTEQGQRPHRAVRAPHIETNEPQSTNPTGANIIKFGVQPVNNLPVVESPRVPEVENQTPQVQKTLNQAG